MMNIDTIIKEAQEILFENTEWKERFSGYAEKLLANKDVIKSNRRKFNQFKPLYFYITTSRAQNAKSKLVLDIRYLGQSVATLTANKKSITISTKGKEKNNYRDFECDIKLNNIDWRSSDARKFRKFFKKRNDPRKNDEKNKKNEEHNVESLLLSEFEKRDRKHKPIPYIKPIGICDSDIRFGMPTALRASNHEKLEHSKSGGGIDIFARTGTGGRSTRLTVIEVKDENNSKEPPKDALKQGIQYSVFIRELLHSNCGKDWYKIFGFKGSTPKNLTIRAVCAMPDDDVDKSFAKQTYLIEDDKIECHYIYFKYNGKKLTDIQTSL